MLQTKLLLPLAIVMIASLSLSGCLPTTSRVDVSDQIVAEDPTVSEPNQAPTAANSQETPTVIDAQDAPATVAGSYVDYSPTAVATATQNGGKAVLFFHASWCPTCKVANQEFTSKAAQIPAGVTVIKTDYDSSTELKKKYGVTYQHTFVQVDSAGNELAKWNGGAIEQLKKEVK